jgi:type I restriction enzyme S subunit
MKALQNPVSMRPIKSLCRKITSGGTPSRKSPEFFKNGTVPWVKTGELGDATIEPTGVSEWITQFALQNSSAKLFGANTILMAMYGDGKTIGRLGFVQIPVSSNQACCALICNPTICEPWFLFYALMDRRTDLIRLAHGGAQRNLSCRIIGDYEIPLPQMRHQKSAAKTLRGYDDLIENNTRRIAILEEMARRIFEEWFVHFRAPGCEGLPLIDSPIGPIPQGWEVKQLDDIVDATGLCANRLYRKAVAVFARSQVMD